MANKHTAYVLGMTCNGLSVARSLGRNGVRVVAIDSYSDRVGLKSKYVKALIGPSNIVEDERPWLDYLIELSASEPERPVLFPTEDAYVLFIAKHRQVLSRHFEFNIAPDEIVYGSVSKLGTYHLAVENSIPTPWTYLVRTYDDYEKIKDQVTFPCALKPSLAHVWLRTYTDEKLLVIERPEQLQGRLQELMELGIEVVLQEILPGGDKQVYVFGVYVGREGGVLGHVVMHKQRQWPVDFGVGAFDISIDEPRLTETALNMLSRSGYQGMASTEYMLDPRDGQFKLIDINPRTCMIGELAIASGVDLPYLYYLDVTGEDVTPISSSRTGVKWWCFEWDLKSFLEHRRRGDITFLQWLASLRGDRVCAYYASDDLGPFVADLNRLARLRLSKLLGSISAIRSLFTRRPSIGPASPDTRETDAGQCRITD